MTILSKFARDFILTFMTAAMFVIVAISHAYADYDSAKEAFDDRRFKEAFTGFTNAAQDGHVMAQYYLGVMYATGRTLERDDESAYKWFMAAALQGHAISQGNIGTMKLNGRGTAEDLKGSYYWFILSEDGGFEKSRKFMWRVTNFMSRDDINSTQIRADQWIKENRN